MLCTAQFLHAHLPDFVGHRYSQILQTLVQILLWIFISWSYVRHTVRSIRCPGDVQGLNDLCCVPCDWECWCWWEKLFLRVRGESLRSICCKQNGLIKSCVHWPISKKVEGCVFVIWQVIDMFIQIEIITHARNNEVRNKLEFHYFEILIRLSEWGEQFHITWMSIE